MISFVIPAHDEECSIAHTIEAVHAAARALGRPYEVIVVDDASGDRTAARARQAGARVVAAQFRQIARARNAGAHAATGEHLVFVDADTLVGPGVVAAALSALEQGAVGGGALMRFDGALPLYTRPILLLLDVLMRGGLAAGCFFFCTRAAFEAAGGFDPTLYAGEEIVLSLALRRRGRFVILPDRVVTSGRKLRTHSALEVLGVMARIGLLGPGALKSRKGLGVWYGPRREEKEELRA